MSLVAFAEVAYESGRLQSRRSRQWRRPRSVDRRLGFVRRDARKTSIEDGLVNGADLGLLFGDWTELIAVHRSFRRSAGQSRLGSASRSRFPPQKNDADSSVSPRLQESRAAGLPRCRRRRWARSRAWPAPSPVSEPGWRIAVSGTVMMSSTSSWITGKVRFSECGPESVRDGLGSDLRRAVRSGRSSRDRAASSTSSGSAPRISNPRRECFCTDRDTGDHASAADWDHDGIEIRDLSEEFESDGSLTGDDSVVVVRRESRSRRCLPRPVPAGLQPTLEASARSRARCRRSSSTRLLLDHAGALVGMTMCAGMPRLAGGPGQVPGRDCPTNASRHRVRLRHSVKREHRITRLLSP